MQNNAEKNAAEKKQVKALPPAKNKPKPKALAAAKEKGSAVVSKAKASKDSAKQNASVLASKIKAAPQKQQKPKKPASAPSKPAATTPQSKAKHVGEATPLSWKDRAVAAKDWFASNLRTPKVIVPAVLIVIYVIGSLFFSSHYLPGTVINGADVSWRSAKSVASMAEGEDGTGYSIKVKGNGIDLVIKGSDMDFAVDSDAYIKDVSSHTASWLWPISLLLPRNFEATEGISYSKNKLESLVSAAVDKANEGTKAPQNATVAYDEDSKAFVAVAEREGDRISLANTMDTVTKGIATLQTHVDLGEKELEHPSVRIGDPLMAKAIERANALSNMSIELTVKGKKAYTVSPELIRSWITVDDSCNVVGDLDLITEWARGDLSSQVDTIATARTYTRTSDGKRIEVYGGGTYGWNTDGAELAKIVAQRMADNSPEAIEIPMQSKAEVYVHGAQDWGPRYLDVDLTEQYVRFFDENSKVVMESECVSGDVGNNDETVTGVFALEGKETDKKLIGLDNDGDGEPDYESDVSFWMPFFGGYGLHDAQWRDYFGEDVYQYAGSHGCVNLPYYAAEELYNVIKVGDVVVVHY